MEHVWFESLVGRWRQRKIMSAEVLKAKMWKNTVNQVGRVKNCVGLVRW